ncbi:glycosyltransferase family 2 protein [Paenibacillus hamazuiensis]|uniref:glycosyltransferase family 2 protein n=1 Tax=Paenibacillus hamazuiensis TaxID=2936508 RepID=UPI00200DCF2B|nr:glycosyltransferase family 2 protein [Paenibacillus hamazuiensis]
MQKASIIIPNRNGLSYLQQCIASIVRHTDVPYEIIVVDNGSKDGSVEYCLKERRKVRLVSVPFNRGFPGACNLGLKLASGDAMLLLNNDVIVTPNWLSNLMRCLYSSRETGIVGPTTNYASGRQRVDSPYGSPELAAQAPNIPDAGKWQTVPRLVGFCFLIKRELMETIGLLDEQFAPGHFEDDDYCFRARLAGFQLKIAGDTFVYHHGSASFGQESEQVKSLIRRNYDKFVAKWGFDPHSLI